MIPERVGELLNAYVDDELSPRRKRAAEQLLQQSAEVREYLQHLRESARLVRALPRHYPDRDLVDAALATLAPRAPRPVLTRSARGWTAWARVGVAAAILFAAGTASLVYLSGLRRARPSGQPAIANAAPEKRDARPTPAPAPTPLAKAGNEKPVQPQPPMAVPRPRTQDSPTSPPLKRPHAELASPAAPDAKVRVIGKESAQSTLTFPLRLAGRHPARQMLRDKLRQAGPFRVEITCLGHGKALERLQSQLQDEKVDVVVDARAQERLRAHGTRTDLVLYSESLTARELSTLLERLGEEDADAARESAQFGTLAVSRLTEEDRVNLSVLLGVDPSQLPSLNSAPLGVDIRQPLEDSTATDLARAIQGQGKPRPQPGQPAPRPNITRTAIILPLHPEATPADPSKEIRRFLDSRKERRPATVPLLLILRGANG